MPAISPVLTRPKPLVEDAKDVVALQKNSAPVAQASNDWYKWQPTVGHAFVAATVVASAIGAAIGFAAGGAVGAVVGGFIPIVAAAAGAMVVVVAFGQIVSGLGRGLLGLLTGR